MLGKPAADKIRDFCGGNAASQVENGLLVNADYHLFRDANSVNLVPDGMERQKWILKFSWWKVP